MDTIYAISSGAPPCAIAVMRLSGPGAHAAAAALAGRLPPVRHAGVRRLRDPASGLELDQALVLTFAANASATGEAAVELHLHGGRAVVCAVERALAAIPGLRPAEPGEFTRRALMNGRIDLTEAEALGDLLAAETERQRRTALGNAGGALRRRIDAWTDRVVGIAAAAEALIDHGDEDDLADEERLVAELRTAATALAHEIADAIAQPPIEALTHGLVVVLAGPPNAGKSSLINRLSGAEVAIVTPVAGTTRDRIEAAVVRNGVAWRLVDTAGLAVATDDPVERIGIARAEEAIARADILLWLGDAPPPVTDATVLALHPRADLPDRAAVPAGRIAVSAATGEGIAALWDRLEAIAQSLLPPEDQPALNARQRQLCGEVEGALAAIAGEPDLLIIGEQLRLARHALDRITGRADTEAVLDALFGRFCIGK